MATAEESVMFLVDEIYEFSAPQFYDFIDGETQDDARKAELWFETALAYAPSPFMIKIKTGRSVQIGSLCDFSEEEQVNETRESSEYPNKSNASKETSLNIEKKQVDRPQDDLTLANVKEDSSLNDTNEEPRTNLPNSVLSADEKKSCEDGKSSQDFKSILNGEAPTAEKLNSDNVVQDVEACTPKPRGISQTVDLQQKQSDPTKLLTAKKIASILTNQSALRSKTQSQISQHKNAKSSSVRRETKLRNVAGTPSLAQENQAVKRQKLEGGKVRRILNIKPQNFLHKTRPGLISNSSILCSSAAKTRTEDRKIYVRERASPFVSMAEMVKKFQSSTREISLPRTSSSLSHDDASVAMQRKPNLLTLTRPKEPELETSQRVRSVRIKSSAEMEEEMMAKIPKFKARPLKKKILEAPSISALPRSTPQLPEFKEFHLETMARANQNLETSTVASTESAATQNNQWKPHLTAPRSPVLQTSLRARPPRVKTFDEQQKEEFEKIPKFKARPLNKKIFESKGDLGIFCNAKRQVTIPHEFHFALDERIPQPVTVADLFDKLSLNSESQCDKPITRSTLPNPFHLQTEERGAEKERKFVVDLMEKQLEDEKARIPRANPYPYTTDYPMIPPKPEPKHCTRPEPFQLESLVRHEEEMQREMEERMREEKEAAQMRIFRAQPILKEDPIPLPEKSRKPLTQVQQFNLHIDHRAVDRAEFDKKIKEKEMEYKRFREESESARMLEEERALKQLRRTLVPHARPVPKFDRPFCPQKSTKEITKPKSPKLNVVRRKERRRTAFARATSAAATHMR